MQQPVNTVVIPEVTVPANYAVFTVSANGDDLSYLWEYSADGGLTWKHSTAAKSRTNELKVSPIAANAKLLYRCEVSNPYGTVYTDLVRFTFTTDRTFTVRYHRGDASEAVSQESMIVYGTPTRIFTVSQLGFTSFGNVFAG